VYYNCVKFHKNSISSLVGVALTLEFVKLYTVVVHYLQMCMKEYACCPKFKRGDNSTYTLTKRRGMYLVSATPTKQSISLHAHLQVVHYNCVKFHKLQ
jgi:hypothetical protein